MVLIVKFYRLSIRLFMFRTTTGLVARCKQHQKLLVGLHQYNYTLKVKLYICKEEAIKINLLG